MHSIIITYYGRHIWRVNISKNRFHPHCLKNGKRHCIPNLINADELCAEIRKKIHITGEEKQSEYDLREEVAYLKKKLVEGYILLACGVVMLFEAIGITVYLTDGKDLSDFAQKDWTVFTILGIFSLIDIVMLFAFANYYGKNNSRLNKKRIMLEKCILVDAPLPPGNVINVYMDTYYTYRAVVYGYTDSDDVYFVIQAVDKKFNLITTYSSKVFRNIDVLQEELNEMIKIS